MESGGRDRFDKWNLENALVTETDTPMKLSTVGSIEKRRTGMAIRRSRQSYEISVGFDFIGSYELCNRLVDKTIKQFNEEILRWDSAPTPRHTEAGTTRKRHR